MRAGCRAAVSRRARPAWPPRNWPSQEPRLLPLRLFRFLVSALVVAFSHHDFTGRTTGPATCRTDRCSGKPEVPDQRQGDDFDAPCAVSEPDPAHGFKSCCRKGSRKAPRRWLSIGTEPGLRIGLQKGPLWRLVETGLTRRSYPDGAGGSGPSLGVTMGIRRGS